MIVGHGSRVPSGSLPVFSVGDKREAQELLVLACQTNLHGDFVASELVHEQTLENLAKFSDRLAKAHAIIKKRRPNSCRCLK